MKSLDHPHQVQLSPVPIAVLEDRMLVEEPTVPATHTMVADHPSFAYTNRSEIFPTVHKSAFIQSGSDQCSRGTIS